ncbi:PaaI family thioesterase [Nocardioides marmoriginsengisoli]|uniref:PaaI family thioesterase n=1 Tax=Nocardioides marmoriginsengisoli TaxID=661483 RepID=A0A3N0CHM6_9ACTN|nr:PaaI family thioesterase [Nocardioides marmoriginsengisoli]RNL62779.1 PaaI family thioesterase [Nocardioides marmoriginsengisoli]
MTDIDERREAAVVLAEAGRALNEAIVLTDLGPDEVLAAADRVRALAEELSAVLRPPRTLSAIDVAGFSVRAYNPISGMASPYSPPLTYRNEEQTIGRLVLGHGLEGHMGVAHGGVVAMLFDEFLGQAACRYAWPTVTTNLDVHFLRPVPTREELLVAATVVEVDGSTMYVAGSIALEAEPDRVLAYGSGTFKYLGEARYGQMLESANGPGRSEKAGA